MSLGRIVNVLLQGRHSPRRTQIQSCCSSCDCLRRCPWPMIDSRRHNGHQRGICCKLMGVTPERSCPSALGNAIKRITAGVKVCRRLSPPAWIRRSAFTFLFRSMSNEKRIQPLAG